MLSMMRCTVGDFRLEDDEKRAIMAVVESGRLSEGRRVLEFESEWAKFVGTKYAVATSSGSGAIICGLTALKYLNNYPSGSKVITSPLSYIATASAVSTVNFEPVFVDVDPVTFNITPEKIKELLDREGDDTYKIILPVHLMGYPAEMDKIGRIAKKYGMATFEDAAQAHGSTYGAKKTGSMSDLADFSFYIAHNVQAGEMGAVTTDNPEISSLVRKIKAQGRACDCAVCNRHKGHCHLLTENKSYDYDPRFSHDMIGFNFKTMEFQAALALSQLKKVDWIITRRQQNVSHLNRALQDVQDLFQLPAFSRNVSYLAYPLIIKESGVSRREVRQKLHDKGIETRPLFGCIPTQQPAYSHLRSKYENRLPVAEHLGRNGFYIGCHQYLSEDDIKYMADAVKAVAHELSGKMGINLMERRTDFKTDTGGARLPAAS